jgi:hypothetical protein
MRSSQFLQIVLPVLVGSPQIMQFGKERALDSLDLMFIDI